MDFNALLAVASKNNQMNDKLAIRQKSGFTTNLAPAKRLLKVKPKGVLSESVKAFLEKKDQEEKAEEFEVQKKKAALLQLRRDAKNTRKATAMAKRTKDNIHKLEDTEEQREEKERIERQKLEQKRLQMIEKLKESEEQSRKRSRTTVTASTSSDPPVSAQQRLADKKLMAKFDQDLSDTECDVKLEVILGDKQILDKEGYREREEARRKDLQKQYSGKTKPVDLKAAKRSLQAKLAQKKHKDRHKDKTKHRDKEKHKDSQNKHKDKERHRDKHKSHKHKSKDKIDAPVERKPIKPKFIRPKNNKNALSFADLIKLANQKHEEVLKPEGLGAEVAKKTDSSAVKPENKPPKNERLMTQHEKDRIARKNTQEYKDWLVKGGELKIDKSKRSLSPSSSDEKEKIPPPKPVYSAGHAGGGNRHEKYDRHSKPDRNDKIKNGVPNSGSSSSGGSKPAPHSQHSRPTHSLESSPSKDSSGGRDRPRPQTKRPGLSAFPSRHQKVGTVKPTVGEPPLTSGTKGQTGGTSKSPSSLSGAKRDASGGLKKAPAPNVHTNPFDRIMGQIKREHPKPEKKKRVIESDSDSEYDSELDNFIVDEADDVDASFIDDSEATDYSAAIRDIFGYDRRKFRNENDNDLKNMDAGFAQTLKEEARSAKIGRMEDLADMKMEEEDKKRKMMLKKKLKKR